MYSGSLEADFAENCSKVFPILAGLHTFWFVSLPDTWDRFSKTHIVYEKGELAVGQIIMFPRVPS